MDSGFRYNEIIIKLLLDESKPFFKEYFQKICQYDKFFSNVPMSRIYLKIKSFVSKYNCQPTIPTLKSFIIDSEYQGFTDPHNAKIISSLKYIDEKHFSDSELVYMHSYFPKYQLSEFARKKGHELTMSGGRGDILNIVDSFTKLQKITDPEEFVKHDLLDPCQIENTFSVPMNKVHILNMPHMNKCLDGGFVTPSFIVLVGGAKMGKTHWMLHLSKSFLLQGLNILYVVSEQSEQMFKRLYYKVMFSASERTIESDILGFKEKYIRGFTNNTEAGCFDYIRSSMSKMTVRNLRNFVEIGSKKGKYNLVFLDMFKDIKSIRKGTDVDNKLKIDEILSDIIDLKNDHNLIVVGSFHAATNEATEVSKNRKYIMNIHNAIKDNKSPVALCDYALGLHVSNAEKRDKVGRMIIQVDRHSGCNNDVVNFVTDHHTGRMREVGADAIKTPEEKYLEEKRKDTAGYYKVLNLDPGKPYSEFVVKSSYEKKIKSLCSNGIGSVGMDFKVSVIDRAYKVLSDESLKKKYDAGELMS